MKYIAAVFLAALLFIGCPELLPTPTDYRRQGFNTMTFGVQSLSPYEGPPVKVQVDEHFVVWVMPTSWKETSPIYAEAHRNRSADGKGFTHIIFLPGYRLPNGKLTVHQAALGHELLHVLAWTNGILMNPDELDRVGG